VVYDERRDAVIFRPFQGIGVGVVAENERYFYGRNTGVDYSLEVRAAPRNEYRNAHFLHFDFPVPREHIFRRRYYTSGYHNSRPAPGFAPSGVKFCFGVVYI